MWRESKEPPRCSAKMTDVVFRIQCNSLPVDHATALATAVCFHAPQLEHSPRAGIHAIHVAGSQNGWERPDQDSQTLLLSKRTRLKIRTKVEDSDELVQQLTGVRLEINGCPLLILSGKTRPMMPSPTLFARYAFYQELHSASDEAQFVHRVVSECHSLGFNPTKILCGKEQYIKTTTGSQQTRSLLIADVPEDHSIALQDHGLGDGRTIGCGLMIPHKDTGAVES